MRFLFVDQITEMKDQTITGLKFFPNDDAMQYEGPRGQAQIAPGVISEAIGQLVSWKVIHDNDFTGRPVFLFADRIEILRAVKPGSSVELHGEIQSMDQETLVFTGSAEVDGKLVQRVHSSSGYFMPLADLEDPHTTRSRFADLTSSGLKLEDDGQGFDFSSLIDDVLDCELEKEVTIQKTMAKTEPFYKDHFPRFPVTPIVMINEMIGRATERLFADRESVRLQARDVSNVKIKNFLKPGETCQVKVKLLESMQADQDRPASVQTMAEITKDGKRILRGKYRYDIWR